MTNKGKKTKTHRLKCLSVATHYVTSISTMSGAALFIMSLSCKNFKLFLNFSQIPQPIRHVHLCSWYGLTHITQWVLILESNFKTNHELRLVNKSSTASHTHFVHGLDMMCLWPKNSPSRQSVHSLVPPKLMWLADLAWRWSECFYSSI